MLYIHSLRMLRQFARCTGIRVPELRYELQSPGLGRAAGIDTRRRRAVGGEMAREGLRIETCVGIFKWKSIGCNRSQARQGECQDLIHLSGDLQEDMLRCVLRGGR